MKQSVRNIEFVISKREAIQKIKILKNSDTDLVENIPSFMLLSGDLEKWNVVKSKNPHHIGTSSPISQHLL